MRPGNGLNGTGRRRHPRFSVPAIVLAPTIPDSPVEPENISAGGLKASLRHPPDLESLHEAVVLLPGATFEGCQLRLVWQARKKSLGCGGWRAGLVLLMEERERGRLMRAIEALAGAAPPADPLRQPHGPGRGGAF